jgi:TetR/AcrR family transcriptional regulator
MARPTHASDTNTALSKGAQTILEVAEQLFANNGYNSVSINDIAQQAGVSKANIFHHFKSKEGLFMAVLKIACERSVQALDATPSQSPVQSLDPLRNFFASNLQALLAHPRSTRLIQWELLMNSEQRGKRLAEEVFTETFNRVVDLVRDAQSQGLIKSEIDASLLAFLLVGINGFFFETRAVHDHMPGIEFSVSPEEYSAAVFDLLAHGFAQND